MCSEYNDESYVSCLFTNSDRNIFLLGKFLISYDSVKLHIRAQKRTGFNPLKPNDRYSGRTAPLTSKRCILYIYSTNTGTENFKHGTYSPFLSLQNAVCFIILTYLVPVLFAFYIQSVLRFKKLKQ